MLFEKLNKLAQHNRGNEKFFGGLQLVLCGDFFQLPPVHESVHQILCHNCGKTSSFGPVVERVLISPQEVQLVQLHPG